MLPSGHTRSTWVFAVPALLLAVAVFGQTLGYDFVNWDDDVNIVEHRGVLTANWADIWTGTVIGNYNPLTTSTFALEHAAVGLEPALYHVNNLLLHLACVTLVFALSVTLGLQPWSAGFVALLFAIHPMRVESVAWVTERKDVLYGAFFFGALLLYERRRRAGSGSWHLGVAVLFALALLAKIQAVSLPLAMLCVDYLRRADLRGGDGLSRAWREEVLAKAPYFAMSLTMGLVGVYFLGENGSLEEATDYSALDRLAVGALTYVTYVVKAVWPYTMSPLYPYPAALPWTAYAAFGAVAAVLAGGVLAWRRGCSTVVFALGFFTANVIFMLQVLGAGQGFLADRFTYVAYFGLFHGAAVGIETLAERVRFRRALAVGVGGYTLLLAMVAFRQTQIWRDGGALWAHVTKIYPRASVALGNRAQWLRRNGEVDRALESYGEAIAMAPSEGNYLNSRGKLYFDRGDVSAALADYDAGITRDPELAELHINRGAALASLGDYTGAEAALARGLELAPGDFNGLLNRSLLRYSTGRIEEALVDYDALLRQRPERHDLWQERGSIRASQGHTSGGIADLREALRRAPDADSRARYTEILGDMESTARR